jgi:hypothetical protein
MKRALRNSTHADVDPGYVEEPASSLRESHRSTFIVDMDCMAISLRRTRQLSDPADWLQNMELRGDVDPTYERAVEARKGPISQKWLVNEAGKLVAGWSKQGEDRKVG